MQLCGNYFDIEVHLKLARVVECKMDCSIWRLNFGRFARISISKFRTLYMYVFYDDGARNVRRHSVINSDREKKMERYVNTSTISA